VSGAATPLAGQTALITGAATGIGRGIAAQMVQAGARVLAADIDVQRVAETAAEIGAQWAAVDVRSRDSVFDLARAASRDWSMTISGLAERDQVIKRPVEPEEIGDVAVFFATSRIITGQAINVDGGLVFS
jgi:NAD(P)-dependent dehydrogenase (short-subunit alcohol dehydrogenase family)